MAYLKQKQTFMVVEAAGVLNYM